MNIYVINALFFGFSVFLISILILLKRGDDIGRRWFYFSIFVAIWAIFYAFQINNDISNEFGLAVARINNVASAFIPATWLYFICGFLNIERRRVFWCSWLVALILMITSPTNLFIPSVSPAKGFVHYMDPGPIFHLHSVNFFIIVSYGFYLMIYAYWKETSREKRIEIFSLLLATVFGFVGGSTAYALVYLRDGAIDLTLLLCTFPFIMAYVMIKHRVLDIEKIADAFQREKLAAIGTLAASVNHELKNPLYVARGSLESYLQNIQDGIYKEGNLETASKKAAETALRQLTRAGEIMQRLTDFAKPYTEGDLEKVLLQEVLQDVLELANSHFHAHKINSTLQVGNDLFVIGNRRQLEEIFFNLIVNSCQAMRDGGQLTICAEQRNGKIQVEIQDQGLGIPPNQIERIFEPFYTTKETGTGLGLYVTKQLVERNNGRIFVKSQLNKGTYFILSFSLRSGQ